MLAATCFHCGHAVEISPDADRCEACGANLRRLISAQQASRYFYMRAAELSARSEVAAALAEVQRGLAYQPSSELHLLGAILCKRLNKPEEMRHHVAAIPVDDVLRGEAEWLLRSSQARQRVPADPRRAQDELPLTDAELLPVTMEEVRPSSTPRRSRWPGLITAVSVIVLLALGGWWLWTSPPDWLDSMLSAAPIADLLAGEEPPAPPTSTTASVAAPAAVTVIAEETPTPLPPTPLPTPVVAPDLAQQAEPLAAASPQAIIVAPPFDLKTVLIEAQRPELAESVTGRLEGGLLVVEGTAPSVEARDDLAALLARLPGIQEVSLVNVLVRPSSTYTVEEGDSLWAISVKLYGTPDRIQAIFEANQAVLASPNDLRVGMVLQIPPLEE
ncbi:MAG TPA: LysM peptidoglycan-binding domain-containing protein [Chloroflexi bacterium]|nr:LysM peptidoglycan-binding domain-containing protein [Chloroflexota bacterium]